MNIFYIDPFLSSSHGQWFKGFKKYSSHKIELDSENPEFWKNKLLFSAFNYFDKDLSAYKHILLSSMIDASLFKSIFPDKYISTYMHENQISYPENKKRNLNNSNSNKIFSRINIASLLASDKVFFNSYYHQRVFLSSSRKFLKDNNVRNIDTILNSIEKKSTVLYIGIDFKNISNYKPNQRILNFKDNLKDYKILLWNHRLDFDKNPEQFFLLCRKMVQMNLKFKIIVLGEDLGTEYPESKKFKKEFKDNILHWGYEKDKNNYYSWLSISDILPVTSNQEFFGISVVEAILLGVTPLLPSRLSYPELIPIELHSEFLYSTFNSLLDKTVNFDYSKENLKITQKYLKKFFWKNLIDLYDSQFE